MEESLRTSSDPLGNLDGGQRDAIRMLFREFRTSSRYAIRRGATRKANRDKCRRFLADYKALGLGRDQDAFAVESLLDAVQPLDRMGCAVTLRAFVDGLGAVAALSGGAGASADGLGRWLERSARPILEEKIPPKYWQAMLRVKQALSSDGQLQALLRRNAQPLGKLFASGAMGVAGIGRLGRGKALTVEQTHGIFLRCNVQGPWLSMHGTELVLSLVKAWSSADTSKSTADDNAVEEDSAITKREFTRSLMMAAHVMYCGGVGADDKQAGAAVHDALLSLFAEMESSEMCRQLGVRFSGVGGSKLKTVLTRSSEVVPSATPRAAHGTPSRREARHLATVSNVAHASPARDAQAAPAQAANKAPSATPSSAPPADDSVGHTVRCRPRCVFPTPRGRTDWGL